MGSRSRILLTASVTLLIGIVGLALLLPSDESKPDSQGGVKLEQASSESRAELEAALKDAATAQELYLTRSGAYATRIARLEEEGLVVPDGITINLYARGRSLYCIEASDEAGLVLHLDSRHGVPTDGECGSGAD